MNFRWEIMKDKRRDKCKCGKFIIWDPFESDNRLIICKYCGTEYKVDCDSILVHWLVEKQKKDQPWQTEAR